MTILGIDPSLNSTGYAFINDMKLIESGIIKTKSRIVKSINKKKHITNINVEDRINFIVNILLMKKNEIKPVYLSIEEAFYNFKDPSAVYKQGQLIGALCQMMKDLKIYRYYPNEIKSNLGVSVNKKKGLDKNNTKIEVMEKIKLIYKIKDKQFASFDESDAIAIGYKCYTDISCKLL